MTLKKVKYMYQESKDGSNFRWKLLKGEIFCHIFINWIKTEVSGLNKRGLVKKLWRYDI
jgi:hypothetical protein